MTKSTAKTSREEKREENPAARQPTRPSTWFSDTDRAVSEISSYAIQLSLIVFLLGGFVTAAGAGANFQTEVQKENTLQEVGQDISSQIQFVDRLARESANTGVIRQRVVTPDRVGDNGYTIEVLSPSDATSDSRCEGAATASTVGCIIVYQGTEASTDVKIKTYYQVAPGTDVQTTTLTGGDIIITRPADASQPIELTNG
ncbi:hypothetical protein RYH80_18680 [Halobaculum sp. MBLA0147]|uniref:DUF7266 family protein n=1 Tax=Halobaculum sp. MBLA0147 TaxID=3079934 RepID=UPI0035235C8F